MGKALSPEAREAIMTGAERLIQQGELRGQQRMLMRLLQTRFESVSSEIEQRLRTASEAELDAWAERVLSASTIEEVFAG